MKRTLLKILTYPLPLRVALMRRVFGRLPLFSYQERLVIGSIDRPYYGYCIRWFAESNIMNYYIKGRTMQGHVIRGGLWTWLQPRLKGLARSFGLGTRLFVTRSFRNLYYLRHNARRQEHLASLRLDITISRCWR